MMKRMLAAMVAGVMAVSMAACGSADQSTANAEGKTVYETNDGGVLQQKQDFGSRKASPDKYTQYVDNYVGMNAASVGNTSFGGERQIDLGAGRLIVTYVTPDGSYAGPYDEDGLKNYVVVAQSIEPNTEVKLTFMKDNEGNEYDSLVEYQTYSKIDLLVKEVGSEDPNIVLTKTKPSPDIYTFYIQNYVGKNLASIGSVSYGGEYEDTYGNGAVRLNLVADDGSYIDPSDETVLMQYVVTGQNVDPGSELKYVFETDHEGNEYTSLVNSQTYEAITLSVKSLTGGPVVSKKESEPVSEETSSDQKEEPEKSAEENEPEMESSTGSSGGYEEIYNEYAKKLKDKTKDLITEYKSESSGLSVDKKAELANDKVEVLADLSNEGVEKMAKNMLSGGSDDYMEWSEKLYSVYMEQSGVLMGEYMSSAME